MCVCVCVYVQVHVCVCIICTCMCVCVCVCVCMCKCVCVCVCPQSSPQGMQRIDSIIRYPTLQHRKLLNTLPLTLSIFLLQNTSPYLVKIEFLGYPGRPQEFRKTHMYHSVKVTVHLMHNTCTMNQFHFRHIKTTCIYMHMNIVYTCMYM